MRSTPSPLEKAAPWLISAFVTAVIGCVSSEHLWRVAALLAVSFLVSWPAFYFARQFVINQREEGWRRVTWLPLRGRHLAIFVATLVAIPGVVVMVLAIGVAAMVLTR